MSRFSCFISSFLICYPTSKKKSLICKIYSNSDLLQSTAVVDFAKLMSRHRCPYHKLWILHHRMVSFNIDYLYVLCVIVHIQKPLGLWGNEKQIPVLRIIVLNTVRHLNDIHGIFYIYNKKDKSIQTILKNNTYHLSSNQVLVQMLHSMNLWEYFFSYTTKLPLKISWFVKCDKDLPM